MKELRLPGRPRLSQQTRSVVFAPHPCAQLDTSLGYARQWRHRGVKVPTSYRIDEKSGVAYFIATGTTTELEWVEGRARLQADPRYQPGMRLLVDVREHRTLLSTEFLTKIATGPISRARPAHVPSWALVVSRQVEYGLGRMLSLLAEPNRVDLRVFRDIDEAERWLRDGRVLDGREIVKGYPPGERPA